MTTRYDAVISRKDKEGKTRYTKIGAAFPSKQGEGFNIVLDALPMPNAEGQAWISLFVPKDKDQSKQNGKGEAAPERAPTKASARPDMDDEIPF